MGTDTDLGDEATSDRLPRDKHSQAGAVGGVRSSKMKGVAARLFGLPNQIAIMDHLAEWMRQHLDARFASAQLYDPKLKRLRVVAQREFASGLLDQFGEMS